MGRRGGEIGDQRRQIRLPPCFEHLVDPVQERLVRESARDVPVTKLGHHLIPLSVGGAKPRSRLFIP
jgi:hypothetical protein